MSKWDYRLILIETNNDEKNKKKINNIKKIYKKYIKKFHKRFIKIKIKINKDFKFVIKINWF